MANQDDEDFKMALRLSMQHQPPEPKRSKPEGSNPAPKRTGGEEPQESLELRNRRVQRELRATAAEKRMMEARNAALAATPAEVAVEKGVGEERSSAGTAGGGGAVAESSVGSLGKDGSSVRFENRMGNSGKELSAVEAQQLFLLIFGGKVTKDVLAQWSNQGIRFSPDPETSMGLVQLEGGPCGVLATLQAFVLKYLLFHPEESGYAASDMSRNMDARSSKSECTAVDIFSLLTEETKSRALVRSMCEILFLSGNNETAVIASIGVLHGDAESSGDISKDDVIAKALEGVAIESGPDLQKVLRVEVHTSKGICASR